MTLSVGSGPVSTPVEGVTNIVVDHDHAVNWDADFRPILRAADSITYTNVKNPPSLPETILVGVRERANVYTGSSIEASAQLSDRRGVDFRVELRQTLELIDSTGEQPTKLAPARVQISGTWPVGEALFDEDVLYFTLGRLMASLASQGDDSVQPGLNLLLHGVTER